MSHFLDYLNFHQKFEPVQPAKGSTVEEAWEMTGVYLREAMDGFAKEHPELQEESASQY